MDEEQHGTAGLDRYLRSEVEFGNIGPGGKVNVIP